MALGPAYRVAGRSTGVVRPVPLLSCEQIVVAAGLHAWKAQVGVCTICRNLWKSPKPCLSGCKDAGQRVCSPHARGWSRRRKARAEAWSLLPARAGMVPRTRRSARRRGPAPRTRGDGPYGRGEEVTAQACSPHARGWSLVPDRPRRRQRLLPARAGMVPTQSRRPSDATTAPRTRGDGPTGARRRDTGHTCSPHARGWSRWRGHTRTAGGLLPARTGMVPAPAEPADGPRPAPRTRGDGPRCDEFEGVEAGLLPARAGMVPGRAGARSRRQAAPRTRGMVPAPAGRPRWERPAPRTRGWSHGLGVVEEDGALLPARAGMLEG